MAEKLNREALAGAECPSCGGALWMQSQDCCVKAVGEVKKEVAVEEPEEEEVLEEEDEEEEVDYSSMKVAELKELLKIKGLETTGEKADLIERLEG